MGKGKVLCSHLTIDVFGLLRVCLFTVVYFCKNNFWSIQIHHSEMYLSYILSWILKFFYKIQSTPAKTFLVVLRLPSFLIKYLSRGSWVMVERTYTQTDKQSLLLYNILAWKPSFTYRSQPTQLLILLKTFL